MQTFVIKNKTDCLNAIRKIKQYREKQLPSKLAIFESKLADCGIQIAKGYSTGHFGKFIVFSKKLVDKNDRTVTTLMIAKDSQKIISEWYIDKEGNTKQAEVSPVLMEEFGSGLKAENPLGIIGVGQGTFPEQTHAFDTQGWWYKSTEDDTWHHSYGYSPNQPMYHALMDMQTVVTQIASEVFK